MKPAIRVTFDHMASRRQTKGKSLQEESLHPTDDLPFTYQNLMVSSP
jgi:hypothetical protein